MNYHLKRRSFLERTHLSDFLERLQIYDNWTPENRFLIYYEDLLQKPEIVLKKILNFMEEDDFRLQEHLANLEEDRAKIIDFYSRRHKSTGGSTSKGKDIHYHSKKMPKKLQQQIQNQLQKNKPNLWEKYLSRYEINSPKDSSLQK